MVRRGWHVLQTEIPVVVSLPCVKKEIFWFFQHGMRMMMSVVVCGHILAWWSCKTYGWNQYMTLSEKALKFIHQDEWSSAERNCREESDGIEKNKHQWFFFKCLMNLKGIGGFCVISPLGKLTFKTANFSLKLFKAPTLLKWIVKFSRFSLMMYQMLIALYIYIDCVHCEGSWKELRGIEW